MVLKRSQTTPSTTNSSANDVLPSSEDLANQGSFSTEVTNENSESKDSKDSKAAQALTEFYNILQKIFSYLPAKELNKCAR